MEEASPNLLAQEVYSYDSYNNRTDVFEYDYGSGVVGSLLRHTVTSYLTNGYDTFNSTSPLASIHIRDLPSQETVFDGIPAQAAVTQYCYDNNTTCTGLVSVTAEPGITGHDDTNFGTSRQQRGNPTRVKRAIDKGATTFVTTQTTYDVAGNVLTSPDGNTNVI